MADLARIHEAFTSTYHSFTFWSSDSCPATLLIALRNHFPDIETNSWEMRLKWGGVFLDGARILHDTALTPPCRIEYYEPRYDPSSPLTTFSAFSPEMVLYEDRDLLAVFKPDRLPTMPGREQVGVSLKSYLEQYVGSAIHIPSRIDTSTSGVVVVSKSPTMHAPLQRLFERRAIEKTYLLEVEGEVPWKERKVEAAIGKDPSHPVLRKTVETGGKAAETNFILIEQRRISTLLQARPISGRTHQIRVHAQSIGFPIIGDNFYGGKRAPALHLLAYSLKFRHPFSKEIVNIVVPENLQPEWSKSLQLRSHDVT